MAKDEIIKDIASVIDKIYEKFLLRDLFAKIVPGLIFIATIFYVITGDVNKLDKLTKLSWIILIGFAWIVAFGIQSVGEFCKLIKYYTSEYKSDSDCYIEYNTFQAKSTLLEKGNCERLVVIKEATGNLSVTFFISIPLILLRLLLNNWEIIQKPEFWVITVFLILFGIFLQRMHRVHVNRQCEYVKEVNNRNKESIIS